MTDSRGYQPEGVKYTFPDDDPYQEGNEVYYNMAEFLNDDEFHQIWEIVGNALDRNGFVDADGELSIRVYDETLKKNVKVLDTITLTDDQFNTLFFRIDRTVKLIIDASVEYQNSDLLNEYEDLFDVHTVLEQAK